MKFTLRDGRTATVQDLSFAQFSDRMTDFPRWRESPGCFWFYEGFKILSPGGLELPSYNDEKYDRKNAGPMELQPEELSKNDCHRIIATYVEDELAGTAMVRWVKGYSPMWHYSLSFVETHTRFRNQGIGRALLRAIDNSQFLDSKILQLTHFEPLGREHLTRAVSEELRAKNYALLPVNYDWDTTPQCAGKYDVRGNILSGSQPFDNDAWHL